MDPGTLRSRKVGDHLRGCQGREIQVWTAGWTHDRELTETAYTLTYTYTLPISAPYLFSSGGRHTRLVSDWSSDVCSSDLCSCCRSSSSRKNGSTNSIRAGTNG